MDLPSYRRGDPQRDQTAHHKTGDDLSERQVGNRQGTCGIQHHHQGSDDAYDQRCRPAPKNEIASDQECGRQIAAAQGERPMRRQIGKDDDRIRLFHIVFRGIRPAYKVHIIIECIDR